MKTVQILKIYEYVSTKDRLGVSFLQISRETNIPISTVRKCLTEFSSFFVKVGGSSSYTLNRLTNATNSIESLITKIEKTKRQQALACLGFAVFTCCMAVVISIIAFNGS
ncbi:MAG: hypothetical protein ACJAYF_002908 [Arenicella sp.]|jgi:hypothetical protein